MNVDSHTLFLHIEKKSTEWYMEMLKKIFSRKCPQCIISDLGFMDQIYYLFKSIWRSFFALQN